MRVCIPTVGDEGMGAMVAQHFGSAPFFTLVDVEAYIVQVRPNPACHTHPGSCHHIGMLRSEGVDAVVCKDLGRTAFAGLQQAGLQVLQTPGPAPEVVDVVAAVRAGRAVPMSLTDTCPGHAQHAPAATGGHRHQRRHQHRHEHRHEPHHPGNPEPEQQP